MKHRGLPLALKGQTMAKKTQHKDKLPPTRILPVQCPMAGRVRIGEAGRSWQSKQTRTAGATDLHELHHGHWVEEVEPGEAVLPGGGIGYVRDLQRGSVAGKDCVSVERKL